MKNLTLLFITAIVCSFTSITGQEIFNIPDSLKSEDAIIISEDNTISISGKKAGFLYYYISKKARIKILTEEGVKKYSQLILPEPFDPLYYDHAPIARNVNTYFSIYKIHNVDFKVLKGNELIPALYEAKVEEIKSVGPDNRYDKYYIYKYKFLELKPGDELSIEYNYEVKYIDNFEKLTSFRIFFNGSDIKLKSRFLLEYEKNLTVSMTFCNKGEPDSVLEQGNKKIYKWTKENLPGCMDESGSRPYMTVPYFMFTIKPSELIYTLPYSFEEKYIPLYALAVYLRESEHLYLLKDTDQGVNNHQYWLLNEFINNEKKDVVNDSTGYQNLLKIHRDIVDEFSFQNDIPYFDKIDMEDERLGDFVAKKTLRDISRYNLYVSIISRLGLEYFSCYLMDNRIGNISAQYIEPMFKSDYLFCVLLNNNRRLQYLYPKKSRAGFYLNELPFYYEGDVARLIHVNDYCDFKKPISESVRTVETPNSLMNDNVRKCDVLVECNPNENKANFKSKMVLTGQYSTLTRGFYQYNEKDYTINNNYYKKIWDFSPKNKLLNSETNVVQKEFPFKTNINAAYTSDGFFKIEYSICSFSCTGLFPHVIYDNFSSQNRKLDFYPDFAGKDTFTYVFVFADSVSLIQDNPPINISNSFGDFIFKIDQPNSNSIRVTSYFSVSTKKVSAGKSHEVESIYDAIRKINEIKIMAQLSKTPDDSRN